MSRILPFGDDGSDLSFILLLEDAEGSTFIGILFFLVVNDWSRTAVTFDIIVDAHACIAQTYAHILSSYSYNCISVVSLCRFSLFAVESIIVFQY